MPLHTIVHVSDPHLLAEGLLYGAVDCDRNLRRFVERVIASEVVPDAIVVTGDVADQGEPEAYVRARAILDPLAEQLGTRLVWVMGNHDHRVVFSDHLLDGQPTNQVVDVGGLRIIALDSTVPGYHHGCIEDATLEWLRDVLAEPAEHGTVLALHHPPLEAVLSFLRILDLRNRERLADVVRGSDVRLVLAGHWHLTASGRLAGAPVLVAGATSYCADPSAAGSFVGVDGGQSYRLVKLDGPDVQSTVVPLTVAPTITMVTREQLAATEHLDRAAQDERWSRFPVTDLV